MPDVTYEEYLRMVEEMEKRGKGFRVPPEGWGLFFFQKIEKKQESEKPPHYDVTYSYDDPEEEKPLSYRERFSMSNDLAFGGKPGQDGKVSDKTRQRVTLEELAAINRCFAAWHKWDDQAAFEAYKRPDKKWPKGTPIKLNIKHSKAEATDKDGKKTERVYANVRGRDCPKPEEITTHVGHEALEEPAEDFLG